MYLRLHYMLCFVVIFLAAESKANQFKWSIHKDLPARRQNQLDLLPPPAEHTGKPGKTTRQHLERPFKVENCDNIAYYCFKAYNTGRVCARSDSLYVNKDDYEPRYQTMDNYCMMDYINCSEGFDVWKVAHLGACMADKTYYFNRLGEYYEYFDDIFLDNTYVIME